MNWLRYKTGAFLFEVQEKREWCPTKKKMLTASSAKIFELPDRRLNNLLSFF